MNSAVKGGSITQLTRVQMAQMLDSLRETYDRAEVISKRENRIVIRCPSILEGKAVVIKMWSLSGVSGKFRRLLHISPGNYEWRNLTRLYKFGISVPRPLGFCRVEPEIDGYTDALFMEDLGPCELATEHLKRLIVTGQESQALVFENAQIEMTSKILNAGMLDVDHGIHNIVVQSSGRPVKLDVELGRRVIWPRLFPSMYGQMLGRMLGMHAFAVQPDMDRMTRFAGRLRESLNPPQKALKRGGVRAREMMQKQFQDTGIDTRLILPWD